MDGWLLGDVEVDLGARRVRRPGRADERLTPTEHALLRRLIDAGGQACTQEELLRDVWGYRSLDTSTLATTVRRLRKKIEPRADRPRLLVSVSGGGYRLDLPARVGPAAAALGERLAASARLIVLVGDPAAARGWAAEVGARLAPVGAGGVWEGVARAFGWAPDRFAEATLGARLREVGPARLWLDGEVDPAEVGALLAACPEVTVVCRGAGLLGLDAEVAVRLPSVAAPAVDASPWRPPLAELTAEGWLRRADPIGDLGASRALAARRGDLHAEAHRRAAAGDVEGAAGCALAVSIATDTTGGLVEAIALVDALPAGSGARRARAELLAAQLERRVGRARDALSRLERLGAAVDPPRWALCRAFALRGLGRLDEAEAAVEAALRAPGDDPDVEAELHHSLATIHSVSMRPDRASPHIRRAVAIHTHGGHGRRLAFVWLRAAVIAQALGRPHHQALAASQRRVEALESPLAAAVFAEGAALLAARSGADREAWDRYREAEDIYREMGDIAQATRMQLSGATVGVNLGHLDAAEAACRAALPVSIARGDAHAAANARFILGEVALRRGDRAAAVAELEAALAGAPSEEIRRQAEARRLIARAPIPEPGTGG